MQLIPLDKNPDARPIGVGRVLERIAGKAILSVIKPVIMIFDEESTNALLLVDADRMVLLHNIKYLRPPMAIYIVCHHAYLYLEELNFIITRDHKEPGIPFTMPIYAIGIIPLLEIIKPETPEDITMKTCSLSR